jgi:hypothetical protein
MALDWAKWELLIAERGVHVDRIAGNDHRDIRGGRTRSTTDTSRRRSEAMVAR